MRLCVPIAHGFGCSISQLCHIKFVWFCCWINFNFKFVVIRYYSLHFSIKIWQLPLQSLISINFHCWIRCSLYLLTFNCVVPVESATRFINPMRQPLVAHFWHGNKPHSAWDKIFIPKKNIWKNLYGSVTSHKTNFDE